jgi:gallate dioxygenase
MGDPKFAEHVAKVMVADEFDLSYFQGKGLDHGAFSPLSVMVDHDHDNGWALKLLPIVCGVLDRAAAFGAAVLQVRQVAAPGDPVVPEDIKVAIAGTGGLSHQVHGEGCGFNNPTWDHEFMELLEKHPETLLDYPIAKLAELGGWKAPRWSCG